VSDTNLVLFTICVFAIAFGVIVLYLIFGLWTRSDLSIRERIKRDSEKNMMEYFLRINKK